MPSYTPTSSVSAGHVIVPQGARLSAHDTSIPRNSTWLIPSDRRKMAVGYNSQLFASVCGRENRYPDSSPDRWIRSGSVCP